MVRTLTLRARHFKTANFASKWSANLPSGYCGCPIERAASEEFATDSVQEEVFFITVGNTIWYHRDYEYKDFVGDKMIAMGLEFSDDVVRELKIATHERIKTEVI